MASRKAPDTPAIVETDDGRPVDTRTGTILDGTFGDEDQDLSRFEQDTGLGRTTSVLTPQELASIRTAQDLLDLMEAKQLEIADSRVVLSDGSQVVQKAQLENRPFFILDWKFVKSKDHGSHFSVVTGIVMDGTIHDVGDGQRFVFTDGGMGIHDELAQLYLNVGSTIPIACKGLTPSRYAIKHRADDGTIAYDEAGEPITVKNSDGSDKMGCTWRIA